MNANQTVKVLKNALVKENIKEPLIINTDKGGNFLSKTSVDYVNNEPLIIPSMTDGGRPDQNP